MNLDCGYGKWLAKGKKRRGRLPVVVGCYTVPVKLKGQYKT